MGIRLEPSAWLGNESAEASIPAVLKTAGMDALRIRRTLLAKPEALFRDFADYECRNVAAYLNNPTLIDRLWHGGKYRYMTVPKGR